MITNKKIEKIETGEVLLNGTVVAKGAMSCGLLSELKNDEFGGIDQQITITGALETGYYLPDIHTIETNRYYVEGITVNEEKYGSSENRIIYLFSANLFQVKFQDERDQYYIVDKEEEDDDWQQYLTY